MKRHFCTLICPPFCTPHLTIWHRAHAQITQTSKAFHYIKGDKLSILPNLARLGLLRAREPYTLDVVACWQRMPLRIKVISLLFLCLALLSIGVMSLARTQPIPKILAPPALYLPGNPLPELSKKEDCHHFAYIYLSCYVNQSDQEIFFDYELSSQKIIHTTHVTNEYKIGELIVDWGTPTGMTQYGSFFIIYWGTRSAVLYTNSFQPNSRIASIGYDWKPQQSSPWRGFSSGHLKKGRSYNGCAFTNGYSAFRLMRLSAQSTTVWAAGRGCHSNKR